MSDEKYSKCFNSQAYIITSNLPLKICSDGLQRKLA